jgi:hypothetical protein
MPWKNAWTNEKGLFDDYGDADFFSEVQDDTFHIETIPTSRLPKFVCKTCGGDKFFVGVQDYATGIKCPNCGWELIVHVG